ncbi:MAG: ABC transporter substrate-binding protein [Cyanobacteria bacterium J06614_10]
MTKKVRVFLRMAAAVGGFALFGCAPTAQLENETVATPAEVTEDANLPAQDEAAIAPANRVVALTSLSADLAATLDVDKLVGIPGSRLVVQDSRFAEITTVSEGRTEPDLEKIIDLQPDLVIGAKGFHDKALQRLSDLGISVLTADINSWENLRSFTTTLATALEADADPLLERYDACLSQPQADSPSALVLVSRQPILAPNKNSWAGDFLSQFNVQNLAADLQGESEFDGYVTLSAEKVIEADPDSIMVVDTGEDLLSQLKAEPFWNQLKATKEEAVLSFDYFGLVNPGSLASIEATCDQLKNEL